MNKYFILPYKMGSNSSKALAKSLGAKQIYPDRYYKGKPNHILINWGYSTTPQVPVQRCKEVLNQFSSIPYVSNKLLFFQFNSTGRKVQAIFNKEEAKEHLFRGKKVFCRTILNGKGGDGIVLARTPEEVVDAQLYTVGADNNAKEYRIHIFKNNIFHIQQKRKMSEEKLQELGITHTSLIRNYNNGYVFSINNIDPPSEDTLLQAKKIIADYNLDFGAVDIIQSEDGTGYVLEINSAPGLEGTTLDKYTETFNNYLQSL